MNTLWQDVVEDSKCVAVHGNKQKAYIYRGIKIINNSEGIKIYNTKKSGLNYKEITDEHYYYFLQHGFKKGVSIVLKKTYTEQIDKLNEKIQSEVNNRNNKKHYDSLKQRRETLISKYSKLN
jgi:hypothetical protein